MADYLFIRIGESDDDVSAVVLNADGRIIEPTRRAPLEALRPDAEGRRVVVLVPATEAITTRAELPKASQARLRQLLPYSLEDAFAADIDSLHFAPGRRLASGATAVSVIDRQRLDAWLAAVNAAGLRPQAVYSEADGVPDTPSTLNLLVEGERIYGRRPDEQPFVLEGLSLGQVLDLLTADVEQGVDLLHLLVYVDAQTTQQRLDELAEIQPRVASLDVKELVDGALPRLAATLVFEPGTNLLQGPYAAKSDFRGLWRPWYVAASLLSAWILLTIGAEALEYFALKREDQVLTEQITTTCARSFSSSRIAACTTEMRSRLAAAGQQGSAGGESFLTTLAVVADSRVADSRIEALNYRNRVMDLQLVVPSVTLLDAFAEQISGTNRFEARIQSANPSDSGVEGRVQVVGATR
jgi:general secretion pathway protein L